MKIFVAYGFNERDKWVKDMVFPIIEAFGDEVIKGDVTYGETIPEGVKKEIKQSDALIGFATRRGDPYADNKWLTHRWVTEEMTLAISKPIPVVEVREEGVDDQGGILGDRQRIIYKEKERDKCLVELVKAIGKWHQMVRINLKLLPEKCVQELFPLHRKGELRCTYTLLDGNQMGPEIPAKIIPIAQGLFIRELDVPRHAYIQINIEYKGTQWTSSFESTDTDDPEIYLTKSDS